MENLALGHACSVYDLFVNFPDKKFKLTKSKQSVYYRKQKAASIFLTCVKLVIQDIIDNNIQFKLPPLGNCQSYIQMEQFRGKDFKNLFKAGKWKDIDFLATNFTGYQIAYFIKSKVRPDRKKLIYLSSKYNKQITEKVNNGFTY